MFYSDSIDNRLLRYYTLFFLDIAYHVNENKKIIKLFYETFLYLEEKSDINFSTLVQKIRSCLALLMNNIENQEIFKFLLGFMDSAL